MLDSDASLEIIKTKIQMDKYEKVKVGDLVFILPALHTGVEAQYGIVLRKVGKFYDIFLQDDMKELSFKRKQFRKTSSNEE